MPGQIQNFDQNIAGLLAFSKFSLALSCNQLELSETVLSEFLILVGVLQMWSSKCVLHPSLNSASFFLTYTKLSKSKK